MNRSKHSVHAKSPQLNNVFAPTKQRLSVAIALATQLMAGHVLAGPEGGAVVGGAGSINSNGKSTTIHQRTDRMAIDWQSYNVAVDERVEYIQPSSDSLSLNRIMSTNGSEIQGRIDANGIVLFNLIGHPL